MKRIITLSLTFMLTCLFLVSYAQSPRMVLVEEATQASCPPCATQNPPLHAMLDANSDKTVFIAYQVWWPGEDAMYDDNPDEVDERIGTYYSNITGAPNIVVQGTSSPDLPSYLTQNVIDQIYGDTSEFDMTLNAEILNGQLVIGGSVEATAEVSGDLRLRLVIMEKLIHEDELPFPGTNAETEFHNVFKKFVNGPQGITLSNSWMVGDSYTIDETFDLSTLSIYNYDQIIVAAMVQNDDNKFVHQAAKAEDLSITVDLANNAAASSISGLPSVFCPGMQEVSPIFNLQNNGNVDLTSATITYNVNGGADQSYDWTGTLTTFQKESVALPAISFETLASNVINVSVSNPNNTTDEDLNDNQTSSDAVPLALTGIDSVTVEILTDNYGDETYWEIRNSNGVVAFGGNPNVGLTNINTGTFPAPAHPDMYANATMYSHVVYFDINDCYTFHITDYYGDGMSLSTVPAYYRVLDGNGVELVSGGNESFIEVISDFNGELTPVSVEDLVDVNSVNIFPNPVVEVAFVNFNLVGQANASFMVTNAVGQQVFAKDLGNLSIGTYSEKIDMSALANGIYMVQLRLNDEFVTHKITVAR